MIGILPCPACDRQHSLAEWHELGTVCGRCNQHTGNNNQGHYWAYCKVNKQTGQFHFCCPGNCALESSGVGDMGL